MAGIAMLTRQSRGWIGGIGLLVVPMLLVVLCLAVNELVDLRKHDVVLVSTAISIAGGLVCVWILPLRAFWKTLISILFIPASIYPLMLFQLVIAVALFGWSF